eukprot:CAMPEP_0118936884 /NCGR_PEP_ID=MMETSP1169-20130426/20865_1 /TAXON_ID=36882 /ORGANISM="Pyramimonas obovata, Strain CCMP722" /LENGTH=43 /DNA_ID= /DNA_START= /DNA_END= /DNA_ORIENTATION=
MRVLGPLTASKSAPGVKGTIPSFSRPAPKAMAVSPTSLYVIHS